MIGFEQEDFAFAHAIGNEAGAVAEISEPANVCGGGVNHKANRLNGVVRHGESFDGEIAHFKGLPGFKNPKLKIAFVNVPDFIGGMSVAINRNAELGGQHAQAGDVVGMFMGDENAIEPFGGAIEREQCIANAFGTEAAIDEHARAGRFQVRSITAAAAAKNGEPNFLHAGGSVRRSWKRHNLISFTRYASTKWSYICGTFFGGSKVQAVCVPLVLPFGSKNGNNK